MASSSSISVISTYFTMWAAFEIKILITVFLILCTESASFIMKINRNDVKVLHLESINNEIVHIILFFAGLARLWSQSLLTSPMLNSAYATAEIRTICIPQCTM